MFLSVTPAPMPVLSRVCRPEGFKDMLGQVAYSPDLRPVTMAKCLQSRLTIAQSQDRSPEADLVGYVC